MRPSIRVILETLGELFSFGFGDVLHWVLPRLHDRRHVGGIASFSFRPQMAAYGLEALIVCRCCYICYLPSRQILSWQHDLLEWSIRPDDHKVQIQQGCRYFVGRLAGSGS